MRKILMTMVFSMLAISCAPDGQGTALEERVRRLEDEKEIRALLVRYGEYLDAKDYAGYASLFASDGVSTTGFGSATGPAAIEVLLEENMGAPPPGYINKDRLHLMTTMIVDVSGDAATAQSRYTVFDKSEGGRPVPLHAGRYADVLVRENGAWKLKSRTSAGVIPYRAPPQAGKN